MIKETGRHIVNTVKKHPQIAVGFTIFSVMGFVMLIYYMRKNKHLRYAQKWVGEKEIAGNMGFENKEFDELMRKYGDFKDKSSWCASFVKMVMIQKAGKRHEKLIDKLITPSTQQTFENIKNDKSGLFSVSNKAHKGDIVIWQLYKNGKPTWQGHIGIIKKANKNNFISIEGNTSEKGSREGIMVAVKERKYDFKNNNGLRIKGFIHFKKIV